MRVLLHSFMAHLAANKKNNALRKTQMTQRKMRCSANA
jgi:hypothetical protein